ncbi:unnamed protein product [Nezara viridula]|uniref:Uncharacterized protein n=1 Tax=Nezara viridula TaxID=85310 RepID=A0A9P0DWL1_NEZVI|nr:unnamed protein product [Nezara viridula]
MAAWQMRQKETLIIAGSWGGGAAWWPSSQPKADRRSDARATFSRSRATVNQLPSFKELYHGGCPYLPGCLPPLPGTGEYFLSLL